MQGGLLGSRLSPASGCWWSSRSWAPPCLPLPQPVSSLCANCPPSPVTDGAGVLTLPVGASGQRHHGQPGRPSPLTLQRPCLQVRPSHRYGAGTLAHLAGTRLTPVGGACVGQARACSVAFQDTGLGSECPGREGSGLGGQSGQPQAEVLATVAQRAPETSSPQMRHCRALLREHLLVHSSQGLLARGPPQRCAGGRVSWVCQSQGHPQV